MWFQKMPFLCAEGLEILMGRGCLLAENFKESFAARLNFLEGFEGIKAN